MPTTELKAYKTNIAEEMRDEEPTVALVSVLSWVSGVDALALEPLNRAVDTDGLNRLLESDGLSVTFHSNGYEIQVQSCGDVKIEQLE